MRGDDGDIQVSARSVWISRKALANVLSRVLFLEESTFGVVAGLALVVADDLVPRSPSDLDALFLA